MISKNRQSVEAFSGPLHIFLSVDGYVRLSGQTLYTVRFTHLISGLDEFAMTDAPSDANQNTISGYTEWVSETTPTMTLGWDWLLTTGSGHALCQRQGVPRSNIMVTDEYQNTDLGPVMSITLLERLIDAMPWQKQVWHSITNRYI